MSWGLRRICGCQTPRKIPRFSSNSQANQAFGRLLPGNAVCSFGTTTMNTTLTASWESRPIKAVLTLAWPIAVSQISYSTMTLVDTLFVARLGTAELAGVGLGGVC